MNDTTKQNKESANTTIKDRDSPDVNQIKRAKMTVYHSPDYQTISELFGFLVRKKHFNIDFQDASWIYNQNDFSFFI